MNPPPPACRGRRRVRHLKHFLPNSGRAAPRIPGFNSLFSLRGLRRGLWSVFKFSRLLFSCPEPSWKLSPLIFRKYGFRFSGVSISRLESTPNGALGETSISPNYFSSLFSYHETAIFGNRMIRKRRNASDAFRTRFLGNCTAPKRKHCFP